MKYTMLAGYSLIWDHVVRFRVAAYQDLSQLPSPLSTASTPIVTGRSISIMSPARIVYQWQLKCVTNRRTVDAVLIVTRRQNGSGRRLGLLNRLIVDNIVSQLALSRRRLAQKRNRG